MSWLAAPDLAPLFHPRSVAVIGASDDFTKPGGQPLSAMVNNGFQGALYPVNPKHRELKGLPCYPDLANLPETPDLVVVALPAAGVLGAVDECGRAGVRAVIVLSSGFAEVGGEGAAQETRLAALARQHGLILVGPNCMGVISAPNRLMANFLVRELPEDRRNGGVSFISQSGSLGAAVGAMLAARGLGFSRFVSSGNEAALGFADYLAWLAEDPETRIIAGYLEGAADPAHLEAALARAAEAGKPVLIIKAGRSPEAAAAALRHTASRAGDDAAYEGMFRRWPVMRCPGLAELVTVADLLAGGRSPGQGRVAVLTPFGGAGVLLADQCRAAGLPLAVLLPETSRRLAKDLPVFASPLNPVDLTPQVMSRFEITAGCAGLVVDDPGTDILVLCTWIWPGYEDKQARALEAIHAATPKPVVNMVWGPDEAATTVIKRLRLQGIPAEPDSGLIARALGGWLDLHRPM